MKYETRIKQCAKYGFYLGLGFSGWGVIATLLSQGHVLDKYGTSLFALIMGYVVAGVASGAVVGALLPFARWRIGAAFVGIIAAVPAAIAFKVVLYGWHRWEVNDILAVITFSVLLGGVGGIIYREIFSE